MADEHEAVRTVTQVQKSEAAENQAENQADRAAQPGGGLEPSGRYLWYLAPFLAVWAAAIAGLVLYFT